MVDLVMGPFETLVWYTSVSKTKLDVLRTLDCLKIAEHVPLEGDVSVVELADRLKLDEGLLRRFLKCGYLMNTFRESRERHVAHTGVSDALPNVSPYLQMNLSQLLRKGVHYTPDAMRADPDKGRSQVPVELADKGKGGRGMWKQLVEDDLDGKGVEKFSASMKAFAPANFGENHASFLQGFD